MNSLVENFIFGAAYHLKNNLEQTIENIPRTICGGPERDHFKKIILFQKYYFISGWFILENFPNQPPEVFYILQYSQANTCVRVFF